MAKLKGLPEIVSEVYALLEPLESPERQKVIGSVMTLLGEHLVAAPKSNGTAGTPVQAGTSSFGPKASRWLDQNQISMQAVEEVFHCDGTDVEVIASEIPGNGKRAQTHNCYLLAGVRSLLATDDAKFTDDEAISLCKNMGCHDSANHAKTRSELGNYVAGSKNAGFTLPAPGLRAAAGLLKSMSGPG